MTWINRSFRQDSLVDSSGKIIGEVNKVRSDFKAFAKGNFLGDYIDRESAKKAVEKHISDYP